MAFDCNETAIFGQLWPKSLRQLFDAAADHDDIVGRARRMTLRERALDDGRIGAAERGEQFHGRCREIRIAFDRHDRRGQPRQHRRRIARRAADLENGVGRPDRGQLQQPGKERRLHQVARGGAARRKPQIVVGIGETAQSGRDEDFARNRAHGIQDRDIGYVGRAQLAVDHLDAMCREINVHIRTSPCSAPRGEAPPSG
jgi:hypothetical protein